MNSKKDRIFFECVFYSKARYLLFVNIWSHVYLFIFSFYFQLHHNYLKSLRTGLNWTHNTIQYLKLFLKECDLLCMLSVCCELPLQYINEIWLDLIKSERLQICSIIINIYVGQQALKRCNIIVFEEEWATPFTLHCFQRILYVHFQIISPCFSHFLCMTVGLKEHVHIWTQKMTSV